MTLSNTSGAPCWIELFTSDTEAAAAFYSDLFSWTFTDPNPDLGGYQSVLRDGEIVAGMMRNDGTTDEPSAWTTYLETADIDGTARRIAAHGGKVLMGPHPVGELGHMLFAADPGGAMVGAWQPAAHQGFAVAAAPGAPAWFEVHNKEYDASVDFYRDAFDWDVHVASDTDDFRYSTHGREETAYAGIMDASGFLPPDAPSRWLLYIAVTDVDATAARAAELGGSVEEAPQDTPFGRMATINDPSGVTLKLVASGPS